MNPEEYSQVINEQKYLASLPVNNPIAEYNDGVLKLVDQSQELYNIELKLRGKRLDINGQETQISEPLCNNLGVQRIISLLEGSGMNTGNIMTHYEKKHIQNVLTLIGTTLIYMLGRNRINFEIENDSIRDSIFTIVITACHATLHRSWEGGERKFLKGSQHEITTRVEGSGAIKNPSSIKRLFGMGA